MPGMGFGFGFGFHRRASGSGAFTPESLFAASEAGAWYDPSDLSTLWQDTGGTVAVTADGQSVARIDDKSGNGINATQATASKRPVYKTGSGLHWLLPDGVDDAYDMPDVKASASDWVAIFGVDLAPADTEVGRFIDANDSGNSWRWIVAYGDGIGTANDSPAYYDGSWHQAATHTLDKQVLTFVTVAPSSGAIRRNGVETLSGESYSQQGISGDIGLFSAFDKGATAVNAETETYGIILVDRDLTAQELSDAEDWMADKTGVTI